jgi:outer membrane autotransporter protein
LGGTLYVDVAGGNTLAAGNNLPSVVQASAVNGTFATVSDNSTLFNFTASYSATAVNLQAFAAARAVDAVAGGGNPSASGAATVLDRIFSSSPNGAISTAFQGITGGNQAVSNAVSQSLPLLTGAGSAVTGSVLSDINGVIQSRQDSNRGLSSGDEFYGDKRFWMRPFGSWADQAERNGVAGYTSRVGGMLFGADAEISSASRVGLAVAYANAAITGKSSVAPNSARTDIYQLIGYGSYNLDADTVWSYQADVGNNRSTGRRDILFAGTTATSNYSGLSAHLGSSLAYSFALSGATSLTPSVRVDYTRIRDHAYTESGAGALNLNVEARTTESLIYATDARLAHRLNEATTLLANLGAGYDARTKASSVRSSFAGEPGMAFTTTGAEPSKQFLRGGLGMSHVTKDGLEVTARYDIEHRTGFNNQTLSAKLRWAF